MWKLFLLGQRHESNIFSCASACLTCTLAAHPSPRIAWNIAHVRAFSNSSHFLQKVNLFSNGSSCSSHPLLHAPLGPRGEKIQPAAENSFMYIKISPLASLMPLQPTKPEIAAVPQWNRKGQISSLPEGLKTRRCTQSCNNRICNCKY